MADSSEKSTDTNDGLDLEQLRDLSFAPQWSSGGGTGSSSHQSDGAKPKSKDSSGPPRDRRPARKRPQGASGKRTPRDDRPARPEPYRPIVNFSIYPEDEPFDLLTQSIRSSLKVYELFEVTRLIIDKTDRMVVVVAPLSDEAPPLYESLPDRQLFREQAAALDHAANLLLSTVFEEREEEVDPPSGNFSSVLRCKVTGKYLPPRSYHRFHALLQEHQRLNCPEVSLARVEKGLEPVSDSEAVQEWLKSMSRRSVFRLRSETPEEVAGETEAKSDGAGPKTGPESAEGGGQDGETEGEIGQPQEGDAEPEKGQASPSEAGGAVPEATSSSSGESTVAISEAEPESAPAEASDKDLTAKKDDLVLDSREAALNHLVRNLRGKLIRETRQARVPARALVEAVDQEIGKSFIAYIEQQKRFPLETANNVRMKLRKGNFFVFKKGKKGISYVAAVRRKNRPASGVFADSVEKIISVLEAHPDAKLKALPSLLYPDRVDESGKANLQPEETRQIVNDLKWLKLEGYLYEYADGSLEIHPRERGSTKPPQPETSEPQRA